MPLQTVQNAAVRLVSGAISYWLALNFRIHFKILVLTFTALHYPDPLYIADILRPYFPLHSFKVIRSETLVGPQRFAESTEGFKRELKTYF